jgi:hypothetical protein
VKWVFIIIIWYGIDIPPTGLVIDAPDESSCIAKRTLYQEKLDNDDTVIGYAMTECEDETTP